MNEVALQCYASDVLDDLLSHIRFDTHTVNEGWAASALRNSTNDLS